MYYKFYILFREIPERLQKSLLRIISQYGISDPIVVQEVSEVEEEGVLLFSFPSRYLPLFQKEEEPSYIFGWKYKTEGHLFFFSTLSEFAAFSTQFFYPYLHLFQFIDKAPFGITIADPKNRIMYTNLYEANMHGYSPSELVGKEVQIFSASPSPSSVSSSSFLSSHILIRKTLNKHRDGSIFTVFLVSSSIFDCQGNYLGRISLSKRSEDVEKVFVQNGDTDILDQLAFSFSMMRHEIGNFANSIQGIAYYLSEYGDTIPREKIKALAKDIRTACGHVKQFLEKLREISLFNNLDLKPLEIHRVLKEVIEVYSVSLQNSTLRIGFQGCGQEVFVNLDRQAFYHVMFNLLNNARDAVEEVENPEIQVSCFVRDSHHYIQVRDNGCGIPEEIYKNLFKPFFSSKQGGTGLGLVITKKILLAMSGGIQIHSQEGKGTVVEVRLPIVSYGENGTG